MKTQFSKVAALACATLTAISTIAPAAPASASAPGTPPDWLLYRWTSGGRKPSCVITLERDDDGVANVYWSRGCPWFAANPKTVTQAVSSYWRSVGQYRQCRAYDLVLLNFYAGPTTAKAMLAKCESIFGK